MEPFVVASTRVVDKCGRSAYGDFISVPFTASHLLAMDKVLSLREFLAAIVLAGERGARLVGLGAYTSVVTMGGRQLLPYTDVALTTGNSHTVVSGVDAAVSSAKVVGLEMATATGAVVGAGGAIGKAVAILLSEQVQNLILSGNPARPE